MSSGRFSTTFLSAMCRGQNEAPYFTVPTITSSSKLYSLCEFTTGSFPFNRVDLVRSWVTATSKAWAWIRSRPGGAVLREEEEKEAPIFTLETEFSHDLDDDKEAVSPLTTAARRLSDDPHVRAILMMPTDSRCQLIIIGFWDLLL